MPARIASSSAVKPGMFAMLRNGIMVHGGEIKNMPVDADDWDTLMVSPGDYVVISQIAEVDRLVLKRREVPKFQR